MMGEDNDDSSARSTPRDSEDSDDADGLYSGQTEERSVKVRCRRNGVTRIGIRYEDTITHILGERLHSITRIVKVLCSIPAPELADLGERTAPDVIFWTLESIGVADISEDGELVLPPFDPDELLDDLLNRSPPTGCDFLNLVIHSVEDTIREVQAFIVIDRPSTWQTVLHDWSDPVPASTAAAACGNGGGAAEWQDAMSATTEDEFEEGELSEDAEFGEVFEPGEVSKSGEVYELGEVGAIRERGEVTEAGEVIKLAASGWARRAPHTPKRVGQRGRDYTAVNGGSGLKGLEATPRRRSRRVPV